MEHASRRAEWLADHPLIRTALASRMVALGLLDDTPGGVLHGSSCPVSELRYGLWDVE